MLLVATNLSYVEEYLGFLRTDLSDVLLMLVIATPIYTVGVTASLLHRIVYYLTWFHTLMPSSCGFAVPLSRTAVFIPTGHLHDWAKHWMAFARYFGTEAKFTCFDRGLIRVLPD